MIQISPEYLSGKQAAIYLGIGYSTLRRDWPSWTKLGVVPSRYNGRKELRFKRGELDSLMDQWKVIKGA